MLGIFSCYGSHDVEETDGSTSRSSCQLTRYDDDDVVVPCNESDSPLIALQGPLIPKIAPGRRQSKTLSTIGEHGSKIDRNSVFDCHLSPVSDKWQSKTLFLLIFDLSSSIVLAFSIAAYPV